MIDLSKMNQDEWLEADGLGGFASGTVSGIRTRRYHALLLAATNPPAGRIVLVNGFDASVETASGSYSLTSQLYSPDVIHPDGARRITEFKTDPWPQWIYTLEDGTQIQQEIFALHGAAIVCLSWQVVKNASKTMLSLRPFLSGRDYHSMHHENSAFQFHPEIHDQRTVWRPYPGIPAVIALHNGKYSHQPDWYRNFIYEQERARGLDLARISRRPEHFAGILAPGKLYGSWPPKVMRIVK
jgi:predicted glycogen debranching enzyme